MKKLFGIKPPTADEILKARQSFIDVLQWDQVRKTIPMDCWEGEGWCKDEIALGIMIGLKIANDRSNRKG